MSLRVLVWIFSIIIVVFGIFFLLKDNGKNQKDSKIAGIISMVLAFFTFTVQWLIPIQIIDIPIKNLLTSLSDMNVSIEEDSLHFVVGETYLLEANVSPNYFDLDIVLNSSDPNVAIIDETGAIVAIGGGNTTISATTTFWGNIFSDCCTINVEQPLVEMASTLELHIGDQQALKYTANFKADSVNWISSNPEIVSIDQNGVLTTIKDGSSIITVSLILNDQTYDAACHVTVFPEQKQDDGLPAASTPPSTPTDDTDPTGYESENKKETISTPPIAQEPESTLAITGFQMTGDSVRGRVYVKFHVTSNYDLLDGKITIIPGENEDPISVAYNIKGANCQSTVSNPNFAISFPAIESGKTYSAIMDASDISGNYITKEISFTVE